MSFGKTLIALIVFILLIGCTTVPPREHKFDKTNIIRKSYDEVWSKIVQWFAMNNTPIKNIEKASGFISSDFNLSTDNSTLYCDCGTPQFGVFHRIPTGNFSVLVEGVQGEQTKVTITSFFKVNRILTNGDSFGSIDCNSTGVLEKEIFEFISK